MEGRYLTFPIFQIERRVEYYSNRIYWVPLKERPDDPNTSNIFLTIAITITTTFELLGSMKTRSDNNNTTIQFQPSN